MTRLLAFLPALLVTAPWLVLRLAGARDAVVVITGMIPAGWGPEAFPIGFAYVAAHLLATVFGPPFAIAACVGALSRSAEPGPSAGSA